MCLVSQRNNLASNIDALELNEHVDAPDTQLGSDLYILDELGSFSIVS